jgi:hypothetical protein
LVSILKEFAISIPSSKSFSAFTLILYRAIFEQFFCVSSRHIGPAIPTSAYLLAATLGTNWVPIGLA